MSSLAAAREVSVAEGPRQQPRITGGAGPGADAEHGLGVITGLCGSARRDRGAGCGGRPDQAARTRFRRRGAADRDRDAAGWRGFLTGPGGQRRCGRAAGPAGIVT
jgi:hypothetical protein